MNIRSQNKMLPLLTQALGKYSTQGRELNFRCPFCEERGASHQGTLHVNLKKNMGLCHTCKYGTRNVVYIIRDVLGYMPHGGDALKDLAFVSTDKTKFKKEISRKLWPREKKAKVVPLPIDFRRLTLPATGITGNIMYRYLRWRGVTADQIDMHGLGYCVKGKYAGFIVFPYYQGGFPVYFTTRNVLSQSSKKSLNPEEDRRWYWYNYDRAIKHSHVVIVEGPLDSILSGRNVMGMGGKTIRDEQINLLDRDNVEEITVMLDDDAHDDTLACCAKLREHLDKKISYVLLQKGDPADNRNYIDDLLEAREEFTFGRLIATKLFADADERSGFEVDEDDPGAFHRRVQAKLYQKIS